jgi:hypothetical protein
MSGNRKQNHAKPDCGGAAKAASSIHRETNVTAPVLDSTRHVAHCAAAHGCVRTNSLLSQPNLFSAK